MVVSTQFRGDPMRRLGSITTALALALLSAQPAAAQQATPLLEPDAASAALGDIPNVGRPLTHEELLAVRGEMGDADQLTTLVADAVIERRRARDSEHGPVVGTLPREAYPGDPAVEASPLVRSRYPRQRDPIGGLVALYMTQDILLRGTVATPAGTYLTPIEPGALAIADDLPAGALMAVRGWLSRTGETTSCPEPPPQLDVRRLGGGSPFLECPAGWLTPDRVTDSLPDDPLTPAQERIRVQHGAVSYFRQRDGAATYLLRHIRNPVDDAAPAMGWEVLSRLDRVDIPDSPVRLERAHAPGGLEWQPVLERQPPADMQSPELEDDALTATWAGGFASVHQGRDRVASAWVSNDGSSWRSAELPRRIGRVDALLRLGDGLAIIADSSMGSRGDGVWSFDVWRSRNGLQWRRVGRERRAAPARFSPEQGYYRIVRGYWSVADAIVVHETFTDQHGAGGHAPGWTIVAANDPPPATFAWTSRDGKRWERERVRGLSPAASVHEQGGGLFAVSAADDSSIAASSDGIRWRSIGNGPLGLDRFYYWPKLFERTDTGYLIGGTVEEPRGPDESWAEDTVLWHSPDLVEWSEVLRPPPGELISMASVDETVVVVGGAPRSGDEYSGVAPWWLIASSDGGHTWEESLTWESEMDGCPRALTGDDVSIVLELACAPPDAASKYLATMDPAPDPTPTLEPMATVSRARDALECEIGDGIHTRGIGRGGSGDPRATLKSMVQAPTVVPVRGYRVLVRSDDAVLYGYRNGGEVKVAVRVARDGERWRPDGISRCALAEFGAAPMGRDIWMWTDATGRAIHEVRGSEHCWQSLRILHLSEPGEPETARNIRTYVRDPAGEVRDQWEAAYLGDSMLPVDATFTGYRQGNAELWISADGAAVYMKRGNVVEQWPRVSRAIGCA